MCLWERERQTDRQGYKDTWRTWRTWKLLYWPITSCAIFIFRAPLGTFTSLTRWSQPVFFFQGTTWPSAATLGLQTHDCWLKADDCWLLGPLSNIDWISSGRKTETDSCKAPCICCGLSIFNLTIPTYFGCHLRDVLPLIYTGVSSYYTVYTAGTPGSVKDPYS